MIHEDNIISIVDGIKMVTDSLIAKSEENAPYDETMNHYLCGIILLRKSLASLEQEINALDAVWTKNAGLCYYVIISEYGHKYFRECRTRADCEEVANGYCGDNGFAYVYTTDKSYPERDYGSGCTYYFDTIEEALNAAKAEIPERVIRRKRDQ